MSAIGEIATAGWPSGAFGDTQNEGVVFREFLSWDPAQVPEQVAFARAHVALKLGPHWRPGLSPHAPYTVCAELFDGLIGVASDSDSPLAMHLGESHAELELLATGSGPLRTMLENAGVWREDFWRGPADCVMLLQRLATAPRTLVIHGNYFGAAERTVLAAHADRMSLVFCPRTHRHFGLEPYPLAENLAAGVAMAFGTDSRASNPDLNLWRELQEVAAQHTVAPQTIVEIGTRGGAVALGLADRYGVLAAGRRAQICVVGRVAGSTNDDLYGALLHGIAGDRIGLRSQSTSLLSSKPSFFIFL
ncbi:MAG: amidohydrolase family protein [Pirellulales bacterium]